MTSDTDGGRAPTTRSLQELGEFGLIDRLSGLVGDSAAVVGIGDDAAVLDLGGPDYVLATVDMMVEGVHFDLARRDPFLIGRRALAINVSDIAAMGGEPTFALVSLALSPSCPTSFVERMYEGLVHEAGRTRTGIVGGNVTKTSGPICIDVTVLGRVPRDEVVLRSGAQPGDLLAVTGTLGGAAARRLARAGVANADPALSEWADELPSVPSPRVAPARALAAAHLPRAMLDLSDGLAGDIHHLCGASGVGARIYEDRLPISPQTNFIAAALDVAPLALALSGGEDYELLVALPPEALPAARQAVGDSVLTVVGEGVAAADQVMLVTQHGQQEALAPRGWTHF